MDKGEQKDAVNKGRQQEVDNTVTGAAWQLSNTSQKGADKREASRAAKAKRMKSRERHPAAPAPTAGFEPGKGRAPPMTSEHGTKSKDDRAPCCFFQTAKNGGYVCKHKNADDCRFAHYVVSNKIFNNMTAPKRAQSADAPKAHGKGKGKGKDCGKTPNGNSQKGSGKGSRDSSVSQKEALLLLNAALRFGTMVSAPNKTMDAHINT